MRRRDLAWDAGLAALLAGLTTAMLGEGGFGETQAAGRALDGPGMLLAAGSALPLAARRYRPLTVYLVTVVAAVALTAMRYPYDLPVGPLAAIYSLGLAYGGDLRRARRRFVMVLAAAFAPLVLGVYALRGEDVSELLVPEMLTLVLISGTAWLAGDRTRLRRERIAALEERSRQHAREAERERRLAAAEERTRIARELHDSAGHSINVILVQAGAARLLRERDPEGALRAITTVEEVARDTIDEIDRMVRALREDGSEPAPANPAALDELLERHRADGLTLVSEVRGDGRGIPHSVAWAAYRILQEALTNAARHGHGNAEVAVEFGAGAVEITVTNPAGCTGPEGAGASGFGGSGFGASGFGASGFGGSGRSDGPSRGGHGIIGMRERATLLGGTLEVGTVDDTFRLHARLPHEVVTP